MSEQGGSLKLVRQDVPSPIDESSDVHIVDLHFELFVVVPNAAQMKKDAIHAAVEASCKRSAATKQSKPFPAPVHTLLLPSVIPLDLAASFRSSIFGESVSPVQNGRKAGPDIFFPALPKAHESNDRR